MSICYTDGVTLLFINIIKFIMRSNADLYKLCRYLLETIYDKIKFINLHVSYFFYIDKGLWMP